MTFPGAFAAPGRPLLSCRGREIALALSLGLAAACGGSSRCDPGALDVSWTTFTDAAGRPFDCASAAVIAGVRVLVDGAVASQVDGGCISDAATRREGVRLTGVAAGTHELIVDGIDAAGRVRFEDRRTVDVPGGCPGAPAVQASPVAVADDLGLGYSIAGGLGCPAASYVWLSISDETRAEVFAVVDGQHDPTSVPCNTPLVFPAAPFGHYRVDFVQIVTPTGIASLPYRALYQWCAPFSFDHATDDVLAVPPLQAASGPCAP